MKKKTVVEFTTIHDDYNSDVEMPERVNRLLADGWELYGETVFLLDGRNLLRRCQALVRRESATIDQDKSEPACVWVEAPPHVKPRDIKLYRMSSDAPTVSSGFLAPILCAPDTLVKRESLVCRICGVDKLEHKYTEAEDPTHHKFKG